MVFSANFVAWGGHAIFYSSAPFKLYPCTIEKIYSHSSEDKSKIILQHLMFAHFTKPVGYRHI
jgi:hypothetical protein